MFLIVTDICKFSPELGLLAAELYSSSPTTQIFMCIPPFILLLQGEVQALFLRHEGYLGAIGAFLKGAEEDSKEKLTNAQYCPQFDVNRVMAYIDKYSKINIYICHITVCEGKVFGTSSF